MGSRLKGKCIWVNDDFNYNALSTGYEHTVAKIENIVIEDYMIRFFIPNPGYLDRSYSINLLKNDIGAQYSDYVGEIRISCEKFEDENKKKHFLYGKWIEDGETYTWWTIIEVEKNDILV